MFQMKGLCSRSSFYVGFLVGTCSLYIILQQAWYSQIFYPRSDEADLRRLEEEQKNWKKEKSALFNINHPHHIGTLASLVLRRVAFSLFKLGTETWLWTLTQVLLILPQCKHPATNLADFFAFYRLPASLLFLSYKLITIESHH